METRKTVTIDALDYPEEQRRAVECYNRRREEDATEQALQEDYERVAGRMVADLSAALWRSDGDPEGIACEALGTLFEQYEFGVHYGLPGRQWWRRFRTDRNVLVEHKSVWSLVACPGPRGLTRGYSSVGQTLTLLAGLVSEIQDEERANRLLATLRDEHGLDLEPIMEDVPGGDRAFEGMLESWVNASPHDRRVFRHWIG